MFTKSLKSTPGCGKLKGKSSLPGSNASGYFPAPDGKHSASHQNFFI